MRSTVTLACILVVFLAQAHMGFGLLLVAFPLVPWLLYSGYIVATNRARRVTQACKAAVWIWAVLTVIGIHYHRHVSAREKADQWAHAIEAYTARHGQCPTTLDAAGLAGAGSRKQANHAVYFCERGEPSLMYFSTYAPFETESYDFRLRQWKHISD